MAEIIHLKERIREIKGNVISSIPWQFRKSDWDTSHFIQVLNPLAEKLEEHREQIRSHGGKGAWSIPPHFALKGGLGYSIRAIYLYRNDEEKMRRVYYLIGLMDCMINQVNSVLRTDILRSMYKKVFSMKKELNLYWYGSMDQILLPIDSQFFNEPEYRCNLKKARSLEDLYKTIRSGTEEMFDILAREYVFYCPCVGGCPWKENC